MSQYNPPIPEKLLRRDLLLSKEPGQRGRPQKEETWYGGEIEEGWVFAWLPDVPSARELCIVAGTEGIAPVRKIWSMALDSEARLKPPIILNMGFDRPEGSPTWTREEHFRRSVVPTVYKPQNVVLGSFLTPRL